MASKLLNFFVVRGVVWASGFIKRHPLVCLLLLLLAILGGPIGQAWAAYRVVTAKITDALNWLRGAGAKSKTQIVIRKAVWIAGVAVVPGAGLVWLLAVVSEWCAGWWNLRGEDLQSAGATVDLQPAGGTADARPDTTNPLFIFA